LAFALAARSVARWWLGRPGWRQDFHDAVAMARNSDPTTVAFVVSWTYGVGIVYGVFQADDSAVRASEEAVQTAQRAGNDHALTLAEWRSPSAGPSSRCCVRSAAAVPPLFATCSRRP